MGDGQVGADPVVNRGRRKGTIGEDPVHQHHRQLLGGGLVEKWVSLPGGGHNEAVHVAGAHPLEDPALALLVVVGLLAISYVGTMRIYLDQQSDMATARTQIAERQATIAQLEARSEALRESMEAWVKAK